MSPDKAIELIIKEYKQAENKFGVFNSDHEGYAVILEEMDELWDTIKTNDRKNRNKEAIQVAAMTLRFLVDCCYVNPQSS